MKTENPYDLQQKGLKYDALKKSNDELVEAIKGAMRIVDLWCAPETSKAEHHEEAAALIMMEVNFQKALKTTQNDR